MSDINCLHQNRPDLDVIENRRKSPGLGVAPKGLEANDQARNVATVQRLPDVLAWKDSGDFLEAMAILDRGICTQRLRACVSYIAALDPRRAGRMTARFESLPVDRQERFMTAPETVYQVSTFSKHPETSTTCLFNWLDAEFLLNDPAATCVTAYWTALGDLYYGGSSSRESAPGERDVRWIPNYFFRAPCLADRIPIDFFSPNRDHARSFCCSTLKVLDYTPEERYVVCQRLADAFRLIAQTGESIASLIMELVKVVIPVKSVQDGGSESNRQFRGRVVLVSPEKFGPEELVSALVHEAIHQLLFILEYKGLFVRGAVGPEVGVKSLWSGRDLIPDSYFHACFVWYGLANFWARAAHSEGFEPGAARSELMKCLAGFRLGNPADPLRALPGVVREDALDVCGSLHARLEDLLHYSPS